MQFIYILLNVYNKLFTIRYQDIVLRHKIGYQTSRNRSLLILNKISKLELLYLSEERCTSIRLIVFFIFKGAGIGVGIVVGLISSIACYCICKRCQKKQNMPALIQHPGSSQPGPAKMSDKTPLVDKKKKKGKSDSDQTEVKII